MAEAGKDVRRQYDELAFDNFFQRFNLSDLKDAFTENGFRTCRSLMIVTDDDLKEIGIGSLGLRKEVLGAVEEWRKPLLQRAGSHGPERSPKATTNPTAFSPASGHTPIRSPEYKHSPQMHPQSSGIYTPSQLNKAKDTQGIQSSPVFHPSPASPGTEKFHRIRRNESCPYPECTWAGLSTHFHCLVCSSFHTNKTERIRRHIQRHEGADNSNDLDEYQKVKREHFFIFGGKECPEQCKYSEQGVRHLHCKHCDWRTKKFDSRLLAHFKSHHERHLLQYQSSHDAESPTTSMANIRTVSPLPTMAVQEAVQVADAHAANHDGSLPRPPKLVKMETPDGERAIAVHIQQGGYLNRPGFNSVEEGEDAPTAMEAEMAAHGKYKCMVCGETQGLRTALMREQKGRNGPVDWNKTKQLFAYHHMKTTQPAIHWICQKHIEEFVYFSRAYLSMWSTAGVHQQMHTQSIQQQHHMASPENEGEVSETTLVSGMPVYMMLNEHLSEQYKREPDQSLEGEEEEQN